MHIKNFQKADTLLKRLKCLDKEISQIEKYAVKIKDKSIDISLSLSHEKPSVEKIMDDDGSLLSNHSIFSGMYMSGLTGMALNSALTPVKREEYCQIKITEVTALQVLGVMVAHKESERMDIIRHLIEMGFEVNL